MSRRDLLLLPFAYWRTASATIEARQSACVLRELCGYLDGAALAP